MPKLSSNATKTTNILKESGKKSVPDKKSGPGKKLDDKKLVSKKITKGKASSKAIESSSSESSSEDESLKKKKPTKGKKTKAIESSSSESSSEDESHKKKRNTKKEETSSDEDDEIAIEEYPHNSTRSNREDPLENLAKGVFQLATEMAESRKETTTILGLLTDLVTKLTVKEEVSSTFGDVLVTMEKVISQGNVIHIGSENPGTNSIVHHFSSVKEFEENIGTLVSELDFDVDQPDNIVDHGDDVGSVHEENKTVEDEEDYNTGA